MGAMNRRSFFKGALTTGVLAASGVALAGCSPQSQQEAQEQALASTAQVPNGYMCNEDWLGEKPEISDDEITDVVSVDVVVCGSGHAGIQAALAAAEKGATVAVLETRAPDSETGYLHCYGQEIGHYNSQWLQEQGYGPYNVGEIVQEYCKRGGNRVSPEIIRLYVENSGEMFDNFYSLIPSDHHMLEMGPKGELGLHVAYGREPQDYPIIQSGYKTWVGDAMFWGPYHDEPADGVGMYSNLSEAESFSVKRAEELGATWYYNTTAVVCTQNEAGDVTGVLAKNEADDIVKFEAAKGVILATGDFGQNGQMIWQLISEVPEWCSRQGIEPNSVTTMTMNDGSGHKMGCWAGAYIEPGPRPTASMGGGGGGPWGTAPFLWLNAEGKRYMDEGSTVGSFAASIRQPIGIIATVTDSKWLTTVQNASIDHGAPNYTRPQYYEDLVTDMAEVVPAGAEGAFVRSCTITERMPAQVYGSDDLETALKYAGYEGESLKTALESIKHYNELCYAGADTDFGKDAWHMIPIDEPPYYVAPSSNAGTGSAGLITLCGLMTDEKLNCIRPDYSRIKGLYAVGNCLGQRYGNAYSTPTAGTSIGMAMTHGRVAGKIVGAL
ncbi:FAD-binding protein [Eggerthellaceae bacterium 3-80]|nr:FAD-binding protein [bacterium D16-34]